MPSLGTMFYPTITVTEAAEAVSAVEREFRGSITTAGLASHLSMTETGGAFRHKLTALHRYGLLSGRGTLTVTPLGQRIAHPDAPEERDVGISEAFLSIDLFRRIYERFQGDAPSDGQLRIVLEEITGASRRDVAQRLSRIRRLYVDGLGYFLPQATQVVVGRSGSMAEEPRVLVSQPRIEAEGQASIVLSDGTFRFPVERSVRGIQLLRKYLDLLEEQLSMELEDGEGNGVG